ncbi:MAG: hypothetical protein U0992_04375 [Planctomycetaceae bacterium]
MQFHPHGIPRKRRYDARCPKCALERHRLAYLATVINDQRVPHPRRCMWHRSFTEPWSRASTEYVSIDLEEPAMMQMDLTQAAMTFPDESFSLIWCSNVLELHSDRCPGDA